MRLAMTRAEWERLSSGTPPVRPWHRPCGAYVPPTVLGSQDCGVCGHEPHDHPETGEGH